MTRADLLLYLSYAIDDAGSPRAVSEAPPEARLVAWQCGFEPLVVAVWSYLGVRLDAADAEDLARDYLTELGWFDEKHPREADYIL